MKFADIELQELEDKSLSFKDAAQSIGMTVDELWELMQHHGMMDENGPTEAGKALFTGKSLQALQQHQQRNSHNTTQEGSQGQKNTGDRNINE